MKKNLICLLLVSTIISTSAFCQEQDQPLLSKKGKVILPVEGQFAIGFDASPVFTYVGNLMNMDMYNTLSVALLDNQLYGKYLINRNLAARLKISVNAGSGTMSNMVQSDLVSDLEVEDNYSYKNKIINFSPGVEFRKGSSRMQVIYGAELAMTYSSQKSDYSYGNHFTADNTRPETTYNFSTGSTGNVSERVISNVSGKSFGVGARGFVGLEYFVFPKISIGTEIGLSYAFVKTGASSRRIEFWDYSEGMRAFETDEDNGRTQSGLTTDILSGQIVLLFYL